MSTRYIRWRRIRVLAVAGLALGMGAIGTVASYTDTEWSGAQFKGLSFGIEGSTTSTDGINGTWSNHFTEPNAAVMVFGTSPDALLAPGSTFYSRFSMRATPGATGPITAIMSAGTISYHGSTNADMVNPFTFRAFVSPNHSCDSTSASQSGAVFLLGSSSATTSATASPNAPGAVTLPQGATGTAGVGTTICVEVGLPNSSSSDVANGADYSVSWKFEAQIT